MLRTGIFTLKVRLRVGEVSEHARAQRTVQGWVSGEKAHMPLPWSSPYMLGGDVYTSVGPMRCAGLMRRLPVVRESCGLCLAHDANLRATFEGILRDEHPTIIKMSDS